MTDPASPLPPPGSADATFLRRALWVLLIVVLALLVWQLAELLLLIFGAVLVAVILDTLASLIERYTGLPQRWSLAAATLACVAIIGLALSLFGAQVWAQVNFLLDALPGAWAAVEKFIADSQFGGWVQQAMQAWTPTTSGVVRNVGNVAAISLTMLAKVLLVIVGGVYLAAQPRIYRRGLLQLLPPASRDTAREAIAAASNALRRWLIANLFAMVAVGSLIALGLWAIGVPSALTLGLLAGLAEFVPIVGPIFAAIPALLIAMTVDTTTLLWTLALYIVIQQIEGNIIMPMVTRRAVALPPAIAVFAIVALGILFGPLGILLGAPLAVVIFVLVRELYVKRLGE